EAAVTGSSALAVASFEAGAITRLTIIAMTRSRGRLGWRLVLGPSRRSRPIARAMPSTAATWPCGSDRSIVKASWPAGTTTPPFKTPRRPSTCSAGQWLRLSSVRLATLLPSRKLSRSRMAGGDPRLGTDSIYMAGTYQIVQAKSMKITPIHGYKYRHVKRKNKQNQQLDPFNRRKLRLEIHPEKTKIVYCKDGRRKGNYPNTKFDFLGYCFRPRAAMNRNRKLFTG